MGPNVTKASLSPARRRLLELFQQVNFGRVERLSIQNGEPQFDPPPRIVREVKFGSENGPRPEVDADNFLLKTQVVELFQHFDQLGTGTIDVIEVKHGLPFRMIVSEVPA
ncbi:MAG: hypothetical protein KatS3mg082_2568 [Nitrospiraceae bacterium]|nr:MAG: hypothetical protein KatS3mg082_2568 [Nitrospiraceae bacterium]